MKAVHPPCKEVESKQLLHLDIVATHYTYDWSIHKKPTDK